MAQIDEDGTVQCRVRIWGHYQNKRFVYIDPPGSGGSQFYHLRGEDNDDYPDYSDGASYEPGSLYPLKYWWAEGNMSTDHNRARFVGLDMDDFSHDSDDIYIDFIQPLEPGLPTLCLLESIVGVIFDYEHEEWRAALEKGLEGGYVIEPMGKYWGLGVQ